MGGLGWARCLDSVADVLRRGAWYQIVEETADDHVVVEDPEASWGGFSGYDPWVARANNAAFGAQAAYDELVPAFETLFEHEGRDWQRFYDAVKGLAKLPKDERRKALDAYKTGSPDNMNNTHNNEETFHG